MDQTLVLHRARLARVDVDRVVHPRWDSGGDERRRRRRGRIEVDTIALGRQRQLERPVELVDATAAELRHPGECVELATLVVHVQGQSFTDLGAALARVESPVVVAESRRVQRRGELGERDRPTLVRAGGVLTGARAYRHVEARRITAIHDRQVARLRSPGCPSRAGKPRSNERARGNSKTPPLLHGPLPWVLTRRVVDSPPIDTMQRSTFGPTGRLS